MSPLDFLNPIDEWVAVNLDNIVFSLVTIVVVYILFRYIAREIKSLRTSGKLEKHLAFTLTWIAKWVSVAVILSGIRISFLAPHANDPLTLKGRLDH